MAHFARLRRAALTATVVGRILTRRTVAFVPIVVEQVGHGERSYDIYSRLLKERIVCLMGQINDQSSSIVIAQLLFLQSQSQSKPVHLYINSPGGLVTAGLAIYDTMQFVRCPVSTWCVGQACSMGSLLLAAGERGMRYSLPNARIMLHQPSGGVQGQATDILIHAEEMLELKRRLAELYVSHTGMETDKVAFSMERDCFMNAAEAKRFGIVDKVLDRDDNEGKAVKVAKATGDK